MSNNNNIRKAFRTARVHSSTFSKEAQDAIEQLYMNVEAARADAVAAERAAGLAYNQAARSRAQANAAELELLKAASQHSNTLASERVWDFFRGTEGDIVFEGLTRRLARNMMRAQGELLGKELAENSNEDLDRSDMYEADNEEEGGAEPQA